MPGVGDYLRFKDYQTLTNISGDILNIYWFQVGSMTTVSGLLPMADDIETWWRTTFLPPITSIQTNVLTHARLEIDNISDFELEYLNIVMDSPPTGQANSPYAASAVAYSFQLVRSTRVTRHGSKRIAGVPEAYIDNNQLVSTYVDDVGAVAELLGGTQTVPFGSGETMTLLPVIAKSTTGSPPPLPTVFNPVLSATFRGIGSQNSRKQLNS